MTRPGLLGVVLTLCVTAATAQDGPPLTPARDVSVTYRTAGPQAAQELRMSWLVAEQKLRVDLPGGAGWSVVDQPARTMFMVMERQRMVVDMPTQDGPGGLSLPARPPDSARFARAGTATIAGLACTLWRYEDANGRGETCLTADGVMLRSTGQHGGQAASVEATAVEYGAQDPARFRAPAGYRTMQLPGTGSAPGAPPAR